MHPALAVTARASYLEVLLKGLPGTVHACAEGVRLLAAQSGGNPAQAQARRDLALDLPRHTATWQAAMARRLNDGLRGVRSGRSATAARNSGVDVPLSLLDELDMERDLARARLAQAIAEAVGSEFTDLSVRLQSVGGAVENAAAAGDVLLPSWLAQVAMDGWAETELGLDAWLTLQPVLQQEIAHWAHEAYHHANRVLLDHGVRPEIDLRPFIRRSQGAAPPAPIPPTTGPGALVGHLGGSRHTGGMSGMQPLSQAFDETRMLTQSPAVLRAPAQAQAVLGKLTDVVARQVPEFAPTQGYAPGQAGPGVSPGLREAIHAVDQNLRRHGDAAAGGAEPRPEAVLQDLQASRRALKQAAASPIERATIEVVALLFQAILTEERLPASIRVWFARLQMPVLRVAVAEPDFFATVNHPARMLIDRMGTCVMGFVSGVDDANDALHKEIRRIVQVVEAYPDTGRRVFQAVLTEFERFLETYFRDENQASRKGVSLAQQVEQRETWAIQYTIELRKMLENVPVHDGVREFLFRVWADVLAHSAAQTSQSSDETKVLKRAAADLIWSASAKTSREERAEVLRRLPPLLKTVREGMAKAGLTVEKQDEHIQALNAALAAAFAARSAAISSAHLTAVMERLDALDEVLPDLEHVVLDAETLRDLSGHESDDLEVVAEGGTMPTAAMLAWARELQIGAWFQLDYRQRQEPVQLAWRGLQKQLALFVTPAGRGVLFQLHRLGAFLQAGLLIPVEEESLTTRATREALAKLDADPARLLN